MLKGKGAPTTEIPPRYIFFLIFKIYKGLKQIFSEVADIEPAYKKNKNKNYKSIDK